MVNTPSACHLCRYLEESAARFPGHVAAMDPDGASLTYAELDQRAESSRRISGGPRHPAWRPRRIGTAEEHRRTDRAVWSHEGPRRVCSG